MAEDLTAAIAERLGIIGEHIKKLRRDFVQKETVKALEGKVGQNKNVLAETNKKIRELEHNIKEIIKYANQLKATSTTKEETGIVHQALEQIKLDIQSSQVQNKKDVDQVFTELSTLVKEFRKSMVDKESKDAKQFQKLLADFKTTYETFKGKTENYESHLDARVKLLAQDHRKFIATDFKKYKETIIAELKKINDGEHADVQKLQGELGILQTELTNKAAALDKQIKDQERIKVQLAEDAEKLFKQKMAALDHRLADLTGVVNVKLGKFQEGMKEVHELHASHAKANRDENKIFKGELKKEFDHLAVNLSNLNDMQIKLVREELITHVDKTFESLTTGFERLDQQVKSDVEEVHNFKKNMSLLRQDMAHQQTSHHNDLENMRKTFMKALEEERHEETAQQAQHKKDLNNLIKSFTKALAEEKRAESAMKSKQHEELVTLKGTIMSNLEKQQLVFNAALEKQRKEFMLELTKMKKK